MGVVSLLDLSRFRVCVVVCRCSLNLQSSADGSHGASFHGLAGHSENFGEKSSSLVDFLIGPSVLLLLS